MTAAGFESASLRRLPVGAEYLSQKGGTHFRVWAPEHEQCCVVIEDRSTAALRRVPLFSDADGYFSGFDADAKPGSLYRCQLGRTDARLPDPASRFQPFGPDGPSEVIDPTAFVWRDGAWPGITIDGQVLYEIHVGTFTRAGTWMSAIDRLAPLAEMGITAIEMMPVAEFAGERGWGYDGVDLYAPSHLYGRPDDLRRFVDAAHRIGMGVLLDVVYNHLGPSGNVLKEYASAYFTERYLNEWGEAFNFDGERAGPVREFIAANAAYWIGEFHIDGLRIDATQQIFDRSREHVLAEVSRRARAAAASRSIVLVAENEPQDTRQLAPIDRGGFGFDALWNDDFHHAAMVALTGRREAYYTDYLGTPQEFISLAKRGFLYQGQRYSWQRASRGTPTAGIQPARFVTFLQNHDQVANGPSGHGERIHCLAGPAMYRAMTALWLLSPGTPLFFQGQEVADSSPFQYFTDHTGSLGEAVRAGRADFMRQFHPLAERLIDMLPDPNALDTFLRSKLQIDDQPGNREAAKLHHDLLRLRRHDPVLRQINRVAMDGAVLSTHAFLLRYFASDPRAPFEQDRLDDDRLVVVNLGADLHLETAPEPLLAPHLGATWRTLWSSEDLAYGGAGIAPLDTDEEWRIPGHSTVVLAPEKSHRGRGRTESADR